MLPPPPPTTTTITTTTNKEMTSPKTTNSPEGKGTVATGSTRTGTQMNYPTTGTRTSTATITITGPQSTIRIGATKDQKQ